MKTLKSILIASILFVGASLFAQDKMANNIDNSNVALQGYSPVSYLDLNLAQLGNKNFKSEYKKVAYYFTSSKQKATFDKNPAKYLPQYGGFCAFGMSVGAKFRPDPNRFIIKNGKYYLNLYSIEVDAQQLWLAGNHNELVKKANENWKRLSKTHN